MGAWGIGNFDNDDALDWVVTLCDASGPEILLTPIKEIQDSEYIEAPESCVALAAAETIAAIVTDDFANLPDEVMLWCTKTQDPRQLRTTISRKEVEQSKAVVEMVSAQSELAELWQETDDMERWKRMLNGLVQRLASVSP